MKEEREMEKRAGEAEHPSTRLPSEERIGEANYTCSYCNHWLHRGAGHPHVLGQLSAPGHLPEERLSRQTQLLLPALTFLLRALGTQLTPHDLGIFLKTLFDTT